MNPSTTPAVLWRLVNKWHHEDQKSVKAKLDNKTISKAWDITQATVQSTVQSTASLPKHGRPSEQAGWLRRETVKSFLIILENLQISISDEGNLLTRWL